MPAVPEDLPWPASSGTLDQRLQQLDLHKRFLRADLERTPVWRALNRVVEALNTALLNLQTRTRR